MMISELHEAIQARVEAGGKGVGGVEAMFATDISQEYAALGTLSTLAVAYFVARYAYDAVMRKRHQFPASTHIQGDHNTVINVLHGIAPDSDDKPSFGASTWRNTADRL